MKKHIYDEIVLKVIEKGLNALGESPKQAIWFYLEREYNLDRKKVADNLTTFEEGLQKIFGMGYSFLSTLFRQYLEEATGKNFNDCASFAECVNNLYTKRNVISVEMQVLGEPFPEQSELNAP